ncbi:hypothetical protein IU500_24715 [Nocardia terpenica]|uniref:hypothetical protein n=1 Tax=Nocardia terpenica TaxID=455432 RepID=UPI0018950B2E|nr:hypothetical protein [Nocardia terpenica]MBF6064705.1 hypothetical protein [Nocardia terpenica]MBF6107220.1 hypothetical protein [Nocardia terpenica]MBF6114978.1 hypothetical protein [Nocardia terpenica]MBF6122083.1 hypothetical protein [Nocardia terpenica]MBF6154467.1 hypothetical protein [Nocardia terpenica]
MTKLRPRLTGPAVEIDVLRMLAPGGQLTCDQLSRQTRNTTWAIRHAVGGLAKGGLITTDHRRASWRITGLGRQRLARKAARLA